MILSLDNLNFIILSYYHILLNSNNFLILNFAYLMHYFFFIGFLFKGVYFSSSGVQSKGHVSNCWGQILSHPRMTYELTRHVLWTR
jgi:hypothetical protein